MKYQVNTYDRMAPVGERFGCKDVEITGELARSIEQMRIQASQDRLTMRRQQEKIDNQSNVDQGREDFLRHHNYKSSSTFQFTPLELTAEDHRYWKHAQRDKARAELPITLIAWGIVLIPVWLPILCVFLSSLSK